MAQLRIAALGDSLSDEYQFYPPDRSTARNWVEDLSANRSAQLTFGAYSATTRGETRNQGFEQDWARSGARASGFDVAGAGTTFVEEYNGGFSTGLPGLLTQAGGVSQIDVVTILIGANDYGFALEQAAMGGNLFTELDTARDNVINAVQAVVPLLQAANPNLEIVLLTTPDIGVTPAVQNAIPPADRALVLAVLSNSVDQLTASLTTYASAQGLGMVDTDVLLSTFLANPVIAGITLNTTVGGPDIDDFFVGDDFHPGTLVQGRIANAIIGEINEFFPGAVTPLTDAEIVAYAQAVQPVVSLSSSANPSSLGQSVTFTTQVVASAPNLPAPTGTVTYVDTTTNQTLGTVALNNGVATLTTSALGLGDHVITALYNGDPNFEAQTSAPLTQSVTSAKATTTVSLFASANPANFGQPVTYTAFVTTTATGFPPPSGTITFRDTTANVTLATVALQGGVATFSTSSLTAGSHAIVAVYSGDAFFANASSTPLAQTVNPAPPVGPVATTTAIGVSYSRSRITLRISVSAASGSAGVPTGTVTLVLGRRQQRILNLNGGSVTITLQSRLLARRTIVASYSGDTLHLPSVSPATFISPRPPR